MSDYTPDGISDSEPSMEDILASIRKIIADDSSKPQAPAPVVETAALSAPQDNSSETDNVLDLSDDRFSEFVSEDLAPADEVISGDDDILDLTESLLLEDDDLSFDGDDDFDADFDLVLSDDDTPDTVSLKAGAAVAAGGVAAAIVSGEEDDKAGDLANQIEAMSDDNFDATEFDLDIPAEPEQVIDPAADMIADIDDAGEETVSDLLPDSDGPGLVQADIIDENVAVAGVDTEAGALPGTGDADIDLVKSLMAELTEDDEGAFDDLSSGDDNAAGDDFEFEALIDSPEENAPSDTTGIAAAAVDDSVAGEIDDDLASIVAQSSADIEAAKSDAQALQQDDQPFDMAALIEDGESESVDETDESPAGIIGAAIAGASVVGVSAAALKSGDDTETDAEGNADSAETDLKVEAETEAAVEVETETLEAIEAAAESAHDFGDIETDTAEISADPTPTEDTDMPRIVKSDTLAAEETVEATSGAFASLSQVVEEKAVYNESGPRIGDLVQEALKPMLQEWLDKNLKGIVDRAVAKEIKRISSGK